MEDPSITEPARGRVRREIVHVEQPNLIAAKPPGVGGLHRRRWA
jgi:hypothetical protein